MALDDWLAETTRARPDGIALIYGERQWTYAELNMRVADLCGALATAGVAAGQRVAVLMPNHAEYVFLIHALARLGAALAPLNTRLTADELAWQVEQSGAHLLVYAPETADKAADLARKYRAVAIDALPAPRVSPESRMERTLDLNATQAIVFTSGTSGRPKGAMLTFANHFYSAFASAARLGALPDDRWLCCLPLYHVGGLAIVLRCCLYGTTIVLHDGFDVEAVFRALDTERITLVSLVPTMLYRLLEARPETPFPPSVRLVLLGGAAASRELVEACVRLNIPVATTYGLTEAASQVATMPPGDVARKPGSVGKPLLFSSVRIVREDGSEAEPGQYGEIIVSGPTIMRGYCNAPDDPALRNGELHTGDIGYLDDDGDLWLAQRRSDLIVTGGENVYPAEVEAVLRQHSAVFDACVVGVPSAEWGQEVAAAVVAHNTMAVSEADLVAFCKMQLAGYKVPRRIRFFDALPLTASGKIHRQQVTALLANASERTEC